MNKIPKILLNFQHVHTDFEIIEKISSDILFLWKII